MRESEAARVVSMLAAYFPGRKMADETQQLWEREVAAYELEDASEAARALGAFSQYMPSLAGFLDAIREERNRRVISKTLSLPPAGARSGGMTFSQFLAERPDMRQRVEALVSDTSKVPAFLGGGASVAQLGLVALLEGELKGVRK